MTEAIAIERPSLALSGRVVRLLPGVALLFAIGYLGKVAETLVKDYGKAHHLALPNIEYVLWAILIGLVISNTVGVAQVFRPGVATYDFWLKAGIVLLGARYLLGDVLKLGGVSLGLVVIELAVAIGIMTVLGRWFKLKPKLTSLLAVGSSICGVSAIIAAKGAIDADDDDATFAIAAILALGAFGLFAYPAIGHFLHMSDHAFGVWAGLAVDNTAEAAAAGAIFSDAAGKVAVLTKAQIASLANLSRWAFLLTFAGVGLKTDFREIRRQGARPFIVGALAELTVTAVTLGLVLAAAAVFSL